MDTLVRVLSVVGVCMLVQACQDGPPAYMEHSKRAAAETPSPSGNTTPGPGRIVLHDASLTNEEIRQIFAMGYKPLERHGEVYYCRHEVPTGSRFDKVTCRTGDELKRLTQASKDTVTQFQETSGCRSMDRPGAC